MTVMMVVMVMMMVVMVMIMMVMMMVMVIVMFMVMFRVIVHFRKLKDGQLLLPHCFLYSSPSLRNCPSSIVNKFVHYIAYCIAHAGHPLFFSSITPITNTASICLGPMQCIFI